MVVGIVGLNSGLLLFAVTVPTPLAGTILCVDHVIWTGCRILKLASNFEMFVYFFVFCLIEKKNELLCNIFIEIPQPFLYFEGALKYISLQIKKKTQQQKSFHIQHQFHHSRPCPNDMIHA